MYRILRYFKLVLILLNTLYSIFSILYINTVSISDIYFGCLRNMKSIRSNTRKMLNLLKYKTKFLKYKKLKYKVYISYKIIFRYIN